MLLTKALVGLEEHNRFSSDTRKVPFFGEKMSLVDKRSYQGITGNKSHLWKGGKVKIICPNCNKEINIFPSQFKRSKSGNCFCCSKCFSEYNSEKIKGIKNPNWGGGKIRKNCIICHKEFKVWKSDYSNIDTCSKKCCRIHQSNSHKRGDYFNCWICGKEFWRSPFRIKRGENKVCSNRCSIIFINSKYPKQTSSIEEKIKQYLISKNIKYQHQYCFGYWIWDFKIGNYFIECDGDYWHGNPKFYKIFNSIQRKNINRDKRKNTYIKNKGFLLIRFWEDDIKNNWNKVTKIFDELFDARIQKIEAL